MDLFKNNLVVGVGLALAASVLAPIVAPVAGRFGRPLAKSLVKGGMHMYEKGREAIAMASESVEDIMAEIRSESVVAREQSGHGAAGPSTHSPTANSPPTDASTTAPRAPVPASPYAGDGATGRGARGAAQVDSRDAARDAARDAVQDMAGT